MNPRIIMHIDMNAFFASVEQQCNPELRGKPIAVVGANHRTVVTTASYQARAFGVKTGMTVGEAKKHCPHLILVRGNNAKYTDTCVRFTSIFQNYTPVVEVFSIDEAFLDITGSLKIFHTPTHIARTIKKKVKETLGLTCSIGIASNKLLAKLAGSLEKPDGLVEIKPEEVSSLLENLPVKELCGIGPHLERYLAEMGIKTCGELGRTSVSLLKKRFGIIGEHLHYMGQGIDDSPVIPLKEESPPKSIGHSMTLPHDISQRASIKKHLFRLSEMVGRRLRGHKLQGKTIALTIRYSDFTTFTRQRTLTHFIDHSQDIYCNTLTILTDIILTQAVRLLGVSVSHLIPKVAQPSLFEEEQKRETLSTLMDEINNRYGEFTLTWGSLLFPFTHQGVISPAWRPEGARKVEYGHPRLKTSKHR
jgi:DNA polymerase-4